MAGFLRIICILICISHFTYAFSTFEEIFATTKRDVQHQKDHLNKRYAATAEGSHIVHIREDSASDLSSLSQFPMKRAHVSGDDISPENIQLNIPMENREGKRTLVRLSLERNKRVNLNAPVVLREMGTTIPLSGHKIKNAAAYQDAKKSAVMNVWTVQMPFSKRYDSQEGGVHSRYYVGTFVHRGAEYSIAPHFIENPKRNSENDLQSVSVPHEIKKRRDVYEDEDLFQDSVVKRVQEAPNFNGHALGENAFDEKMLKIELRLLLDITVYTYWMRRLDNNIQEATRNMKYFFGHMVNGADMVYRRMKRLNIGIYLLDFQILTTREESAVTVSQIFNSETWDVPNNKFIDLKINGMNTLKSLLRWINVNKYARLADHVSVMTMMDITNGTANSQYISSATIGIAASKYGACRNFPVSVVEARDLNYWAVLAHEIGHNLGATEHDGKNGCSDKDKYIMAPSVSLYTRMDIKNAYRFSQCSEDDIVRYLDGLGSKNCLRKLEHGRHNEPSQYVTLLPGLKYSLDQQCDFMRAGLRFYYQKDKPTSTICQRVYCRTEKNREGYYTIMPLGRAASGTPCGNRKWCKVGSCVYDVNAPELKTDDPSTFKGIKVKQENPIYRGLPTKKPETADETIDRELTAAPPVLPNTMPPSYDEEDVTVVKPTAADPNKNWRKGFTENAPKPEPKCDSGKVKRGRITITIR